VEETWPSILKQAQARGAVILFADEVSFALWGSLSRTWAPRGQQPVVKTTGRRKGMKLFGAIEFESGVFYYREAVGYIR
jgi:DDE superfamily endonuclease